MEKTVKKGDKKTGEKTKKIEKSVSKLHSELKKSRQTHGHHMQQQQ